MVFLSLEEIKKSVPKELECKMCHGTYKITVMIEPDHFEEKVCECRLSEEK